MDKWVKLNAKYADACHYADDLKEELALTRQHMNEYARDMWYRGKLDADMITFDEWWRDFGSKRKQAAPAPSYAQPGLLADEDGGPLFSMPVA